MNSADEYIGFVEHATVTRGLTVGHLMAARVIADTKLFDHPDAREWSRQLTERIDAIAAFQRRQ